MRRTIAVVCMLVLLAAATGCDVLTGSQDVAKLRQRVDDLQGQIDVLESFVSSLELQNRHLRTRLDDSLETVFEKTSGIVLQKPKPFDEIEPGFSAAGYAWVFEGTVQLLLLDAQGNELSRSVATGGGGSFEPFETTVDFDPTRIAGEPLMLQVYSESARGTGEKLAVVETPLKLKDR